MSDLMRGAVFFSCFLPSFTRIGYMSRSLVWPKTDWDFTGQRWVVTGATSGIGYEMARQAAAHGAEVHVVSRSADKLASMADALPGTIKTHVADLSLMSEVQSVARDLTDALPKIDVLVNNVGLMLGKRLNTHEGLEQSFATNVLGHYVMTEALRAHNVLADGIVINMSSGGMYNVPMTLERLQGGDPNERYDGMLTYAYQKRAQVLLNSWWRQQGLNSYVMHPGWVDTPGVETAMPEFHKMTRAVLRDARAGADTALWLAAHKPAQANPGGIWFDRKLRRDHVFSDTRKGVDAAALVEYLDVTLTPVIEPEQAEAPESSAA